MSEVVLKLGTRRSLLAWAQSSWVAREVEKANSGVRVELVGIETRGDRILDVPLSQVQGKEFFVAELDQALQSGTVDFTVHSMKDLSLDRPETFRLGAVPRRENPRDVILFGPRVVEKIREGKTLRIGTSSPRRLENIPSFLSKALPQVAPDKTPKLAFLEIRGNVNTRLSRVHEPDGSERQLDAVVLAFAGLIRLWNDEAGRAELTKLLEGVRWMVLPLRECPTAPAQGALAIECRARDGETLERLQKIHDSISARNVAFERRLLEEWGGGCHQRFGATCVAHERLGELFFVRGKKPDGSFVDELRWHAPSVTRAGARAWDGSAHRAENATVQLKNGARISGAVFVAHARAVLSAEIDSTSARIWTSGTSSWFRLAEKGFWVEGSAEALGYEWLEATMREPVLGLPAAKDWTILTHESAVDGWRSGHILATYRVEPKFDKNDIESLQNATHVFWSSGSQFDALKEHAPRGARHACGPGKTAASLRMAGLKEVDVFPSAEEWRKWLKI